MSETPFRHTDCLDFYDPALLECALLEFEALPEGAWHPFRNEREHKNAMTFSTARDNGADACWKLREIMASPETCERLSYVYGIPNLQFDELGGGLHAIPPGGYLATHVDFNRDATGRYRRVNLLLYLNHDWKPGTQRGSLLLFNPDKTIAKTITPDFNREITFECSDISWHGHPVPHPTRWRRSLAAYYFTDEPPADFNHQHDTVFL